MTSEGIRATTHFLLSSHSSLRMLTIAFLTLLCASASATESKWEAWSPGLDQGKTAACTAGSQGFQRLTWGGGNWVVGGRGVRGRNWALRGFPPTPPQRLLSLQFSPGTPPTVENMEEGEENGSPSLETSWMAPSLPFASESAVTTS